MPDHWTTAVSSNGWTDRFPALQWLERNFEPYTRPAKGDDEYRLLIYDGHDSHITYEFIEYAYAHRNKCLCLPAHSTQLLQPLDIVTFGRYAAEYSKSLDNASRYGITGVDKELFMQLFQEARKGVFTNRLCRSAFRSTGIYPYNPDAVLKNLPELNADENRIGTRPPTTPSPTSDESASATGSTVVATNPALKTPPPERTARKDLPPTTPHNAIGVKQHVEVGLEEFDSLGCQGVELESGIRERVQQLAKSAPMSMT